MRMTSRHVMNCVLGAGLLVLSAGCSHHPQVQPFADQKNLIKEVQISQDEINSRKVSYPDLFYAGKHIFSNRFTTEDHFGEGPDGPRRSKYSWTDRADYPFLRFNGLDSQSCLECHSVIGFSSQSYSDDEEQIRFMKQPGVTGGGAGFASNAFGLTNFACIPGSEGCEPDKPTSGFVRSPPHAFGAGYTQQLAEEMTWDLEQIREKAATNSPGVSVSLESKGVSFGEVVVNADKSIDVAASNLKGVSADLIVRPFQWKGLTSNLRNFITGAMDFHFSIQPKELLDAGTLDDDKDVAINDEDDRAVNEIHEGEISAVAVFLAMLRPPIESSKGLQEEQVEQGRAAFMKADCATCHKPKLKMENPYVSVRDPRTDQKVQAEVQSVVPYAFSNNGSKKGSVTQNLTVPFNRLPPAVEKFAVKKEFLKKIKKKESLSKEEINAMISQEFSNRFAGFVHDLNDSDGPPETLPRLPYNHDGSVDVPLYSDLKRHVMGENLQETFDPQRTDGGPEHTVPGREFLTRPLWGVADTGPWMHDGRALTLKEAIIMHEGTGSEANESIAKYNKLTKVEQKALRAFLSSLRLPKFKPCHWWCG